MLRERLLGQHNGGDFLLGDSGYPLEPWLTTPVPGHPAERTPEGRFNVAHASARSVVERCIGLLKSRLRCLQRYRSLHYHQPDWAATIIAACAALHSIALQSEQPYSSDEGSDNSQDSSDSEQTGPVTRATRRRRLFLRGKAVRDRLVALVGNPRRQHLAHLRAARRRAHRQARRQQAC